MDERERELREAAFHAWVTLGDLMTKKHPSQDEIATVYALLTKALKAYDLPE